MSTLWQHSRINFNSWKEWIPKNMSEMKIWLLRTSTKVNHKALCKLHQRIMKMVFSLWKRIKCFPSTKNAKQAEFSNSYILKSVFRKLCFCEHKCSSVHMISSHTYPISFIAHFFLLFYSYREHQGRCWLFTYLPEEDRSSNQKFCTFFLASANIFSPNF